MTPNEQIETIKNIVNRAEKLDLLAFDKLSLIMDLTCADNEFDMRLEDLLEADEYNFSHDIVGIQNNLNRQELKMENCFVPRYAGKQ